MDAGRFGDVGIRLDPAQMIKHRLGLADLGGDFAVADRLARLLLQPVHLSGELSNHILDAGEVGFGRLQPQFRFMPASMEAGDAGGIFQHTAALFGLGLNDFADLALVDQRRRTRAGGGVGKQDLHVARADVAAVDAINRTCLALDAAGDLESLAIVDGGRRGAIGIVDRHHHFSMVACRTVAGTGKDHRVHVGGAQRFVRRLAHRPAQGLDQVGFAATVRPDDARQSGFDHKIGRFNERLETLKAKARELHKHDSLLAGRESPCRDNTIEGNVSVGGESLMRLTGRNNGDAAGEGQPQPAAFPKGFIKPFVGLRGASESQPRISSSGTT